jgi:outer membrane protein assembly factor BamB
MITRIFSALLILSVCSQSVAEDWPMYRGNAERSGYTSDLLPNKLNLRWVYRTRHFPRPAWKTVERMEYDFCYQPIIAGNLVIFGSSSTDKIYALDSMTGQLKWSYITDGPIRFAPVAWKKNLFVASDDGYLYCLDLSEGKLKWKYRGGLSDEKILGNERLISHWPARGGPVVLDDIVYFAAGIWPSDGIYFHALNAETGKKIWVNDGAGKIEMAQPHGGARARSGVSAQGYLLANKNRMVVPTGRSVPAIFDRLTGKFNYYHLQPNQQRGGSSAMLVENGFINAGCYFDDQTGKVVQKIGHGSVVSTPKGIVRAEGRSLAEYSWKEIERKDRKGKSYRVKQLVKGRLIETSHPINKFIIAEEEAICGSTGLLRVIDYTTMRSSWWKTKVDGTVCGIASGNGIIVASTDQGVIYCIGGEGNDSGEINEASSVTAAKEKAKRDLIYTKAADEILNKTGITDGFCVDWESDGVELALELAKKSKLQIYVVLSDPRKITEAKNRVDQEGFYGIRITVHSANSLKEHYPKRFANLVVSSKSLKTKLSEKTLAEIKRLQRPYGGKVCLGKTDQMKVETRGELKGAGSWTHQNSSPANTLCSADEIVKGPLKMYWFRDVEFELPNRHGQGPAPLFHRGYMVVGGVHGLCALDAYNGRTLWTYQLKNNLIDFNGRHHDVGIGDVGSNFCLGGKSAFVSSKDRCIKIDLASGKKVAEFKTPVAENQKNKNWGYLAYHDGLIFGTVLNQEHAISPRYKTVNLRNESVLFFVMDANTGKLKWKYQPEKSIRNNAIAISGDHVYLIDRKIPLKDRISNPRRNGKPRALMKEGEHESGTLISFEKTTGNILWKKNEDIFGTQLSVSEEHGVLLMHYQGVPHTFFKLPSEVGGRIAGFDIHDGYQLWDQKANYKTRPMIIGKTVYSQGGAWDLKNGKTVPFDFKRSYGCGQITASKHLMLFRSATLGYREVGEKAELSNFGGIRVGCWFNAIPAGGMVLVPDGTSECRCSYQMKAWLALQGQE